MHHPLLPALAVILLVWQASLNIPQLLKVVRTRDAAGLSMAGEAVTVLSGLGWLVYAMDASDLALIISGSLGILGYTPTAFAARRWSKDRSSRTEVTVLVASTVVVGAGITGLAPLAAVLTGLGLVQYTPYVIRATVERRPTGVSMVSTLSRAGFGGGWGLYALLTGSVALGAWSVLTIATFLYVATVTRLRLRTLDLGDAEPTAPVPASA